MAVSKSQKIQAEIDKFKAKISEQQARLKAVSYTHLDVYKRQCLYSITSTM